MKMTTKVQVACDFFCQRIKAAFSQLEEERRSIRRRRVLKRAAISGTLIAALLIIIHLMGWTILTKAVEMIAVAVLDLIMVAGAE